jgi:hypothetical protein
MSAKRAITKRELAIAPARAEALLHEVRSLILAAKDQVAQIVNVGLTALHWQVGTCIRRETLKEKRAEYGAEIVSALPRQLEPEFGRGFSEKSLRHMVRFAEVFPDWEIVSTLSRQLTWSHFLEIIYLKDKLHRDFYAEMCRVERWSVRMLRSRIDEASIKIGYEISFTRYFYKPQPLRTLEEIRADVLAVEKESEGLLEEVLGG